MTASFNSIIIPVAMIFASAASFSQSNPNKGLRTIETVTGKVEIVLPMSLYCKQKESVGFARENNIWIASKKASRIDSGDNFTINIKLWQQITQKELPYCTSFAFPDFKISELKDEKRLCVMTIYDRYPNNIIADICEIGQPKKGPAYIICKDSIIDTSNKTFIRTIPTALELVFANSQHMTMSTCSEAH
jgi:hypothetical protein